MNESDRARVKQAIDHTLSGLKDDPFLAQRIAARAAQSGEGVKMRHFKWIVVALIVVISLLTVAVAGERMAYNVDWSGETTGEAYPLPTLMLTDDQQKARELIQGYTLEPLEVVSVQPAQVNDITSLFTIQKGPKRQVESLTELYTHLAELKDMPLVQSIPAGFALKSCVISYRCKPGVRIPNDSWENVDGFTVRRYVLPENDAVACGYGVSFMPEDDLDNIDACISIQVSASNSEPDIQHMIVYEGETVSVLDVPGMDGAVAVTSRAGIRIQMYRVLSEPILCQSERYSNETDRCDVATVFITAPAIGVETLLAIFGGK